MDQSPPITQHTQLPETWSPPDPGYNQREYSEDEDDIVNFANLNQQESEGELDRCSFIDDHAMESRSSLSLLDLRPDSTFNFLSILQHKSNPQTDPDHQNVTKSVQNELWS